MSPPGAIEPTHEVPHEPAISMKQARNEMQHFPRPPTFTDKLEERAHLKGRLAAAFRICKSLMSLLLKSPPTSSSYITY